MTLLPVSIARVDDPVPSLAPGRYAIIVAVAVVLTFTAAMGATRKAIARPAIAALVA